MRKLASIRKIAEIKPIPDADKICAYRVDGWWVVDQVGKYSVDDLVIYLEVDSWVPTELAPFLSKAQEPREYNGVKGERLRTIKLRGQVSQGLLLPVEWHGDRDKFPCILVFKHEDGIGFHRQVSPDDDVTEALGIQKWEAPISAQLQGQAVGMFPTSLIPKTDQERIQNCFGDIAERDGKNLTKKVWNSETQILEEHDVVFSEDFQKPTYEVTMKLDGSSMTLFRWEGQLRVCSRNLEMKISEENKDNTFVAMALKYGESVPEGFAFQGEVMGPGIQGNREGFKEHHFFVFDIFDIQKHEYLAPFKRRELLEDLRVMNACSGTHFNGPPFDTPEHVPVLETEAHAPESVDAGLALAEGPSINHKVREGLVWKCNEDPSFSFKAISNKFLLSGGE